MKPSEQIKEYLDKLPPVVRSAVLAPEWRRRVGEIAAKYSLHLDQVSSLEYETLFVLIGMEAEDDFASNIEHEVGVSKILAGELANEVSERVFKYIVKLMEEKSSTQPKRFEPVPNTKYVIPNTDNLLSEMEIMANEAKPHEPKVTEPPMNLPGMEEEVQMTPQAKPAANIDQKLAGIVTRPAEKKVVEPTPLVKDYTTDPYREPLE